MSKPNLLAFSTSVGFYRNRKVRDARLAIGQKIKTTVDFRELTPMLFSMLMAYAAENQIDGDFNGYSPEAFQEIFATNHIAMTASQARAVIEIFHAVKLMEENKIRSWKKFNRHLANYEQDKKAKIKAGKERQRRAAEQRNGKPHEEYLGTPQEQKAAASKDKIEWNGKNYFPSELRKVVQELESQIDAKKKAKPDSDGPDSHNICLNHVRELNELEQKVASARSALLGTEIKPKVHKAPPPPVPQRETIPVDPKNRKEAAKLLSEFAATI